MRAQFNIAELLDEIVTMKSSGLSPSGCLARVESLLRESIDTDASGRPRDNSSGPSPCPRSDLLSPREQEVFLLTGRGYTPKEIAAKLSISIKTVGTHHENIKNKLTLENSTQLREVARLEVESMSASNLDALH